MVEACTQQETDKIEDEVDSPTQIKNEVYYRVILAVCGLILTIKTNYILVIIIQITHNININAYFKN
jgi:hypothetical protein